MKIVKENETNLFGLRKLTWVDFNEFKQSCMESENELSQFMHLGLMINGYSLFDYWQLFTDMLKDPNCDHYGLFLGKKLIAVSGVSRSSLAHTAQITYWVRSSFSGQGIATQFLKMLIDHLLRSSEHLVLEFIIDQANASSLSIAKKLNLFEVSKYERPGAGQGRLSSDKFTWYITFRKELYAMADTYQVPINSVIAGLWESDEVAKVLFDQVSRARRLEASVAAQRSPIHSHFFPNRNLL